MDKNYLVAAAAAALTVCATFVEADVIRAGFDDQTLFANDDGSTGAVSLGFDFDFFGVVYSSTYVNNNGNLTFASSLGSYTPFDLTSTSTPIIAPFFADVDTRTTGSEVTYGYGTVDGYAAFAANYVDVSYFSNGLTTNDFQVVLIDRSDTGAGNVDIEFNYDNISWETGDFSGGSGGLGGSSARVGYSNGTGDAGTFFELAGSAVNGAFLNGGSNALISNSNVGINGRYVFEARSGSVVPVDVAPVPLPASLPLAVGGVATLGMIRRKAKAKAKS